MSKINLNIRDLKFEQTEVGRIIKGSKLIYTWEMILDENRRKIELIHSRITGKRRINLDGKNIAKFQRYTFEFNHSFIIDKHFLTLIQTSPDSYELKIDNVSFSSMVNKEKIDKLNDVKKTNQGSVNLDSNVVVHREKKDNILDDVHKIEDEFFENKNLKEKQYFDENAWDFSDKKPEKNEKVNNNDDFFNTNDWNFEFEKGSNKNKNNSIPTNNKPLPNTGASTQQQNKNPTLIDFNDIFSGNSDKVITNQNTNNNNSNNLLIGNNLNLIDFSNNQKMNNQPAYTENNNSFQPLINNNLHSAINNNNFQPNLNNNNFQAAINNNNFHQSLNNNNFQSSINNNNFQTTNTNINFNYDLVNRSINTQNSKNNFGINNNNAKITASQDVYFSERKDGNNYDFNFNVK